MIYCPMNEASSLDSVGLRYHCDWCDRGCVVRKLLAKGAVCVVATLAPVDAFTAEVFVGRLLTDLYNPIKLGVYAHLRPPFLYDAYTTALFYDPMLPLIRKAQKDAGIKKAVGRVFGAYFAWAGNRPIEDVRVFRHEVALFRQSPSIARD